MWNSSPLIFFSRSLSSLVDFLTLVPMISSPASSSAVTIDQLLTPPVNSRTRLPFSRSL